MFPNFESLAHREQKRQALLERTHRRVRQASAKRNMYAGAQWASESVKGVITDPKKSDETTQTDITVGPNEETPDALNVPLSEILKKSLINKNSNKNPEVSTSSDIAVNVRPSAVDVGIDSTPDVSDAAVNVRPSVVDVGIDNTPDVSDAQTSTKLVDAEDQVQSRDWIKMLFKENPNWSSLKINPTNRKSGKVDERYYLGKNGSLIITKSGSKSKKYRSVDWVATEYRIRDIWYEGESKSIDEVSDMRLEDPLYHASLLRQRYIRKRKIDNPSENDHADRTKQRLEDSILFNNSTSTASDQMDSKIKLFWLISRNRKVLESNGLKKKIIPLLNGSAKSTPIDRDGYVWIDGNSLSVLGLNTDRAKPAMTKNVNWRSTLQAFVSMTEDRGIELMNIGNKDIEKDTKEYTPTEGEARHGVLSGADEGTDYTKNDADNEAKAILKTYYAKLHANGVIIPFRLHPIVDSKTGPVPHQTYYIGQPTATNSLNIKNAQHKTVSGEALKGIMKKIRWMDTFNGLIQGLEDIETYVSGKDDQITKLNLEANLKYLNEVLKANSIHIKPRLDGEFEEDPLKKIHDASEAAFQKYGEAQKRYEEAKQAVKGNSSKAARSALKAAQSAVKATKSVYQIKSKEYSAISAQRHGGKLTGRGLRGAGIKPLEGVVRRSRTYNLNEIQGLATPSAYVYRQLGSKYIRIPDLDSKMLVIVQPNRRKCGPKMQISASLQDLIRTLAFKQQIDQAAYDKLSIVDKKIFKEILAITHLQYNFHDRLEDPLESLKAEYDKLKGELELGNDNPSIIKQLKSLSVDMYSNRLISDSEFKDIIVRLI